MYLIFLTPKIKPKDTVILYFSECDLNARKRCRWGWVKTQPPSFIRSRPFKKQVFGHLHEDQI
jgi:hypothetical protein